MWPRNISGSTANNVAQVVRWKLLSVTYTHTCPFLPSGKSKLKRRHFRVLAVVQVRRAWTSRFVLGDSSDLGLHIVDPARLLNYQQILINLCKLLLMRNHPTRNQTKVFINWNNRAGKQVQGQANQTSAKQNGCLIGGESEAAGKLLHFCFSVEWIIYYNTWQYFLRRL